jgi:hypothetical protein
MVRTFELSNQPLKRPVVRIAYDDNAKVYLNGVEAFRLKVGNNGRYQNVPLTAEAAKTLKPGLNLIAIHADNNKSLSLRQKDETQRNGSQFIDAGIGEESIEW